MLNWIIWLLIINKLVASELTKPEVKVMLVPISIGLFKVKALLALFTMTFANTSLPLFLLML